MGLHVYLRVSTLFSKFMLWKRKTSTSSWELPNSRVSIWGLLVLMIISKREMWLIIKKQVWEQNMTYLFLRVRKLVLIDRFITFLFNACWCLLFSFFLTILFPYPVCLIIILLFLLNWVHYFVVVILLSIFHHYSII